MKLLLYTHSWAPSIGGVETVTMVLARGLAKWGATRGGEEIAVTLVTPTPAGSMSDLELPFRVVRQPSLRTLFRLFRQSDVIHLAGPVLLPMVLGMMLRKPIIIEHHGFQTICPNGQLLYEPMQALCPGYFMAKRYGACVRCNSAHSKLTSIKMWILTFPRRWLSQRASANIMPTSWLASLLKLNRAEMILHGISPLQEGAEKRFTSSVPVFAFLGRLVGTKGARVLLEAAGLLKAKHREFKVRIIGSGPERQGLEELVRKLGIEGYVQFLGYVSAEKLEEILIDATAIVIPSLAGEVFGLVAAEVMQRGRLVIYSDIGAFAEVVGDAGMQFPVGDAEGLALCMENALANPALAEEIGRKASRRIAEMFTLDQMIRNHVQVYEAAVVERA